MTYRLVIEDLPHYCYDDYKIWEGDWELIRGIPYALAPSPGWQHQHFGAVFITAFIEALKETQADNNCKVLYSCDWIVSNDTVVRPDVMIVCDKIEGDYPTRPP